MNETEAIGLFNEFAEERRLKENTEFCMSVHKKSVENWTEGNIL